MIRLLPIVLACASAAAPAFPQDDVLAIGDELVGRAAARDLRGNRRSLADVQGERIAALVFLGIECPLANLYVPRLVELEGLYRARGVKFVAVYSNENESIHDVAAHASEHDLPFLVLKDFDQRLATRLGVERTPEVVVLDAARTLRYRGRIDDQYAVAARRQEPTSTDLVRALDELLAGEPVSVPEAETDGCLLDRDPLDTGLGEVTYTRDVAPILERRCQACHRPEQIGPFSLLTYEDAAKRRRMLREVVVQERMPPWHADERYGSFANDRSMTAAEIAVVRAWVDQGAPRGELVDRPDARVWSSEWNIADPDLVLALPEPIDVPADGVLEYRYVVTETGFDEDVWVQEAELRPGNASVLHHVLVYIQPPGARGGFDRLTRALVNWVPGTVSKVNPPGSATRIPQGSTLLWELHYTPNGRATTDHTSLALVFADEPPARETKFTIFADFFIQVAPHSAHHEEQHAMTFRHDVRLVSLRPHMHLRGKSWRYEAVFPDGRTQTLLHVPNWDFNWQTEYFFAEPIDAPQGTVIRSTAHFDNSEDNPLNPDPSKAVRYGRQTFEEMMNGWIKYDLARSDSAARDE